MQERAIMEEENLSAIELYMNHVFKLVILVYPGASLYSGLTYTTIKLLGYYDTVSWLGLIIFDVTCTLYFSIGFLFYKNCETPDGFLKPNIIKYGKIFLAITELTMWNFF